MVNAQAVKDALAHQKDPLTDRNFAIHQLQVGEAGDVSFEVRLGYPARSLESGIRERLAGVLQEVSGVGNVNVQVRTEVLAHAVQRGVQLIPQIKNVIVVASGKGGVGKSTTAVNLALALAAEGARVGLLDADVYGPSLPMMTGIHGKPQSEDGKTMEPMVGLGLQVMSIGFMVEPAQAMIWRGPMAVQALEQMLRQTNWRDLDYLVVDLPPGTGDIQLTLAQRVPVTGAVIVSTPQDIALLDARKAITMFEKVNVPIVGVVENMAAHVCSQCGHVEHIFGADGGKRMAEEVHVDYLGALPLDIRIREQSDAGCPTVVAAPQSDIAHIYREVARTVAVRLALRSKDYSSKIPPVTVAPDKG